MANEMVGVIWGCMRMYRTWWHCQPLSREARAGRVNHAAYQSSCHSANHSAWLSRCLPWARSAQSRFWSSRYWRALLN